MVKIKYTKFGHISFGASWSMFSLGFSISRFSFSLDLGFIWIALEW